jgi:hypothetical protein
MAVDPVDEVEPFKLQELCRMLPALEHVLQVSVYCCKLPH